MSEQFLEQPRFDMDNLSIVTSVQFGDPNQSSAVNRKLFGILPPGIYSGLDIKVKDGEAGTIAISPGSALVEVDNKLSITAQVQKEHTITINNDQPYLVVLEVFYKYGQKTNQVDIASTKSAAHFKVLPLSDIKSNQILIATINYQHKNTLTLADIHPAKKAGASHNFTEWDVHLFSSSNIIEKMKTPRLYSIRDSKATYFDLQGKLITVDKHEARLTHRGILCEGRRTNLAKFSNPLNWGKNRVSCSQGNKKDIDGDNKATKVMVSNSNGTHTLSSGDFRVESGKTYVKSVVVEAGNGHGAGRYFALETDNYGSWSNDGAVIFDLVNGEISGGSGQVYANRDEQAGIVDLGRGRYRCFIILHCVSTGVITQEVHLSNGSSSLTFQGNGTDYIFMHDSIQFEEGSFPSSIIRTTGEVDSRETDNIYIFWEDNKSFENYVISCDVDLQHLKAGQGAGADSRRHVYSLNGVLDSLYYDGLTKTFHCFGGGQAIDSQTPLITDTVNNIELYRTSNEMTLKANGKVGSDTTQAPPPFPNLPALKNLYFGSLDGSKRALWGYIKNFKIKNL